MPESRTPARKFLASALAAALTILSPGIEGYRAMAQVIEAPAVRVTPAAPAVAPVTTALPLSIAPAGPGVSALALPAPSPLAMPAAPVALSIGAPAAAAGGLAAARPSAGSSGLASSKSARRVSGVMAERSLAVSDHLRAAGPVAEAGGENASGLGERVMNALFGLDLGAARSAGGYAAEEAPQPKPESGLKPSASASEKAPSAQPAAPAAAQSPAVRAESVEYATARRVLRRLSLTFGLSFSLPVAGPALADRLIEEAGTKKVVFTDYDDTLDKFAGTASPETVEAIVSVLKAGKTVVVITDRPDTKKPGAKNVTILESLESIPAADRAGLWVAANKGGRILRYDSAGQAQLAYEEPALAADEAAKVKEAADAVKERLAALGAEQHDGSKNIPSENASPYGYALMLKIGTQEAAVKAVAAAFQEELSKRGIGYEVEPRLAKDPAFPPYVTFSKLDKSLAVRRVAGLVDAKAKDSLVLGDSMFAPKPREVTGPRKRFLEAARALGERLSGAPAPLTGNGTDRDMEKGVPGALTLSVGGTADPMMRRAFVMPGKGPEVTRTILKAVAAGPSRPGGGNDGDVAAYVAIPLILGAASLGWYAMISGFVDVIRAAEGALQGAWQGVPFLPMVAGMVGSLFIAPSKKDGPGSDRWSALRRWLARWLAPSGPLPGSWLSERRAEPQATVTDEEVLAAARSTISYKGRPWSQTEYNMSLYTTADSLKARGATEAQLKLYFDTCAAAPIKGGSFNPWSGD